MHELSYCVRFVEMALRAVPKGKESTLRTITVEVGEMTGVLPEYLEKYFPQVIAKTPCPSAVLRVVSIPVETACASCGLAYHPQPSNRYRCPACGCADGTILHGRELAVRDIGVEPAGSTGDASS